MLNLTGSKFHRRQMTNLEVTIFIHFVEFRNEVRMPLKLRIPMSISYSLRVRNYKVGEIYLFRARVRKCLKRLSSL